ncbi:UNVERIFIED_CONTAM: Raucaffricine-O-beta-D-glucosidase [Sesamum radiatum]|uniref:Raucaffricine-O-beta-D-glucosidase n=1 Tax=Sesamum radiatum TaxID=300843 RepID=A0AAW2PLD2_SESRA
MEAKNGTHVNSAPKKLNLHDNTDISRSDFPEGFIFGTGTSAYQVEGAATKGGRSISVWDDLTLRTPDMITDGSNGNIACDAYHRYKDDIKLMKQMGFDSYRFSISWPRVLPGMIPFVTLFHWDLPNCLQLEYGGMLSDQIVNDFVEFAELCFQEFGDLVKFWTTFNEPWSYIVHGYTLGDDFVQDDSIGNNSTAVQRSSQRGRMNLPPHRLSKRMRRFDSTTQTTRDTWFPVNDPTKDAYTAARNLLLCHSAAVQSYREKFQMYQNGKIGIVLNSSCHYPFNSSSQDDQDAVQRAFDFMLG